MARDTERTGAFGCSQQISNRNSDVCLLDKPRWLALCERTGVNDPPARYEELCGAYSQPHRHYHTARHIVECLEVLDRADVRTDAPDEVELAIWMHDIEYDPHRRDNEDRSAAVAAGWLPAEPPAVPALVRDLILATRHDSPPSTADDALVQDVDLHILGADPDRFARYEADVRLEYAWVPEPVFRRARREILAEFLCREHLYNTAWFRSRFEARARINLERSLSRL